MEKNLQNITDLDLPEANRTQANFFRLKYAEAQVALRAANRGLERFSRRRAKLLYAPEGTGVDHLEKTTGISTAEWVGWFELMVTKHSFATNDEEAPRRTHFYAVHAEMLDHVRDALHKHNRGRTETGELYDMTIAIAMTMAQMILAAWSIAVIDAKAHDSARRVSARRNLLVGQHRWRRRFANMIMHQPQIREPWNHQAWQNPFSVKDESQKLDNTDGGGIPEILPVPEKGDAKNQAV